jgi:enoyl-CoA hydratase/carnithine racemase
MDEVKTERSDRILVITMNRPSKRNAVNEAMAQRINAALAELETASDLRAGVITGAGGFFSAGTDLGTGGGKKTDRGEYGIIRRIRGKPLVAAVEGFALGGGLEIVLACDLVVASAAATFGLPEVSRGVIATCGALFRAPRALPLNVARELILTGDPIDAPFAHSIGFVNRLAEPGNALAAAIALAERVVQNSPVAVRESLRAAERVLAAADELGWSATNDAIAAVRAAPDAYEGIAAFREKRPPRWLG